jgi:anti-sigma regulatory factor (Ser/Thr protein kinase)
VTEIRREFAASPVAPALARQALDGWLGEMVGEETADDVRTVTTELIGNAVRYAGLEEDDKIVLLGAIDELHDIVRIEIEQPTPLSETLVEAAGRRDGYGLGLRIVDAVVTEWGLDAGPPGVVWFEVDR